MTSRLDQKPAEPLIVQDLVKTYNISGQSPVQAVRGVSFSLNEGEVFGLLGPNGAGKTSIISTIVTLETPTSGQIFVNGFNNQIDSRAAKQNVGFVPQEIINHGYFNVEEILDFQSGYYGLYKNKERIDYLLNELSLYEHRNKKVKQLSGGMKRRLLIAKSLVHSPKLLLLDEPTAGVDIELRSQLWEFVKVLKKQGVTILLTTHYLEEAEFLCDRVGLLDRGELKLVGETKDLIRKYTMRKVQIKCRNQIEPLEFIIKSGEPIGELLLKEKLNVEAIEDINISEGNLEDAFREVIFNREDNA
ncbi:MAG: ABC transporter ATP-binding protein [Bdellovibrionales bacterium]|nr:ABC transporter ATP-binding protein [Bdellovibrionales bacterium]